MVMSLFWDSMIKKARALKKEDMQRVHELSEEHFPDLEVPTFMDGYYAAFVIEDEDSNIVVAGGLRPSAEILIVTDKDADEIKIGRALVEAQNASLYVGQRFGLNELVAFIKDNDAYARHLVRHGFYPRPNALAIKVPKWVNQKAIQG
jgi:hypothetical protein